MDKKFKSSTNSVVSVCSTLLLPGGAESVVTETVKLFKANFYFILMMIYPAMELFMSVVAGIKEGKAVVLPVIKTDGLLRVQVYKPALVILIKSQ